MSGRRLNANLLLRHSAAVRNRVFRRKLKQYTDIPTPTVVPFVGIGALLLSQRILNKAISTLHERSQTLHNKLGPIYRERSFLMKFVSISDPILVEQVFRTEQKYPSRLFSDHFPWTGYRQTHNQALGLLASDGPEWKTARQAADKPMMRPKEVATYFDQMMEVLNDFIDRLEMLQKAKSNQPLEKLDEELFHWSMESACYILYGRRFHFLNDDRDPEINRFVRSLQTILLEMQSLALVPNRYQPYIFPRSYKRHTEAWDFVTLYGKRYLSQKFDDLERGGTENFGFLTKILASGLPKHEIYSIVVDLMGGASDTTSNAMLWMLYLLSRNPMVQEKIYDEVSSLPSGGQTISVTDLQHIPFVKAVVKETLRLYPVVMNVGRLCQIDNMEIAGYHIPRDILVLINNYVIGRNADIHEAPNSFVPERWLTLKKPAPFSTLPFGFGVRGCIGRRLAEMEMHLLICKLCQNFRILPVTDAEMPAVFRGVISPSKPVLIKLSRR